jgi:hypothetical protein
MCRLRVQAHSACRSLATAAGDDGAMMGTNFIVLEVGVTGDPGSLVMVANTGVACK